MALGDPFTYVDTNNLIHYYESNNWLDLLYGTTWSTQHNIGIQGSSERARWSASLGYADDRSVIIATDDGIKKIQSAYEPNGSGQAPQTATRLWQSTAKTGAGSDCRSLIVPMRMTFHTTQ